jgi:dephospho-CoA kinase
MTTRETSARGHKRRIGLTGGIASGKSTVSEMLADKGALVIDADQLARDVVAPGTAGLAEVREAFGSDVTAPDGSLDRGKLGSVVFADPVKREQLEAIIHPLVRSEAARLEAAAPHDQVVIHDIPLLVETSQQDVFEIVIVVDALPEVQLDRLVRLRGMTEEQARQRIAAQSDRVRRRAAATELIENNGSIADLQAAVDRLWDRLQATTSR